jgi:hypothetical protein
MLEICFKYKTYKKTITLFVLLILCYFLNEEAYSSVVVLRSY